MWKGWAGWGQNGPSSSKAVESQSAELLAPSKHNVLAFAWGQHVVGFILHASHAGHLGRDGAMVCYPEPGPHSMRAGASSPTSSQGGQEREEETQTEETRSSPTPFLWRREG